MSSADASKPQSPANAGWKYDLVGFLDGDFGLAVAARNTLRALEASGRVVRQVPVRLGSRSGGRPGGGYDPGATRRRVTLLHLNPIEIGRLAARWRHEVDPAAFRVCVPFWEMPLVPRDWEPMLGAMHAVLAPTRFVATACKAVVGPERVLHLPQAAFLPRPERRSRDAWGLPRDATIFLVSFDAGSDVERKNPWAAIEAFRTAFPRDSDVRLVIKAKPWPGAREPEAQLRALRKCVAGDSRIRLIEEALSYPELLGLHASCDVTLSLHRSEGLGLHLMEAMSLGRVVVATGWSGNADFMNPGNSVPVGYRLVPVATSHSHYLSEVGREGQEWAEPDVDDAVRVLRMLRADGEARARLGAQAARDMEEHRRRACSGAAFDSLEEFLGSNPGGAAPLAPAVRRTFALSVRRTVRAGIHTVAARLGRR